MSLCMDLQYKRRQVNEKSCRLRMATYFRDGVKRKGDKIGIGL